MGKMCNREDRRPVPKLLSKKHEKTFLNSKTNKINNAKIRNTDKNEISVKKARKGLERYDFSKILFRELKKFTIGPRKNV